MLTTLGNGRVARTAVAATRYRNETSANLAGAAVFAGTAIDLGPTPAQHGRFHAHFVSSHASDSNGAKIQASSDGSTWVDVVVATLAAGVPQVLSAPVLARYMRVHLTNGATLTTALSINTSITPA